MSYQHTNRALPESRIRLNGASCAYSGVNPPAIHKINDAPMFQVVEQRNTLGERTWNS
jgi:hypothetical protein